MKIKLKTLIYLVVAAATLQFAAAPRLQATPSEAALRELAERLATESGPARERVVEQLARAGVSAVPFVANLIPAKETGASDAAVRVLEKIGIEAALLHCIQSLNSPDELVRYRAANALSMMTNQHFGYSPHDTPNQRAQIVARWNAWFVEWKTAQSRHGQP